MKYFIVDDDQSVIYVLQNIIEQNFNDEVVGVSDHSTTALKELLVRDVDIVLVDLLMPELSGIELVKHLKKVKPHTRFVMISKVQDGDMRAEAYQSGIDFFISKPINLIEVKAVLKNVEQNSLSFKLCERGKGLGFGSKIRKCNNGTKNTDGPIKASDRCE